MELDTRSPHKDGIKSGRSILNKSRGKGRDALSLLLIPSPLGARTTKKFPWPGSRRGGSGSGRRCCSTIPDASIVAGSIRNARALMALQAAMPFPKNLRNPARLFPVPSHQRGSGRGGREQPAPAQSLAGPSHKLSPPSTLWDLIRISPAHNGLYLSIRPDRLPRLPWPAPRGSSSSA